MTMDVINANLQFVMVVNRIVSKCRENSASLSCHARTLDGHRRVWQAPRHAQDAQK
jgi:hypothetical protein